MKTSESETDLKAEISQINEAPPTLRYRIRVLYCYLFLRTFAVQTLFWSLEFLTLLNFKIDFIKVIDAFHTNIIKIYKYQLSYSFHFILYLSISDLILRFVYWSDFSSLVY